jgi:hypothetical protein
VGPGEPVWEIWRENNLLPLPDRPGRNVGTGHVEHNMITGRNSAGRNSELHDSLYSIHDEHYV